MKTLSRTERSLRSMAETVLEAVTYISVNLMQELVMTKLRPAFENKQSKVVDIFVQVISSV